MPRSNNPKFSYGKHPNPTNWQETSDILKANQAKPKSKTNSAFLDKLDAIHKSLKESK